MKTAEKHTVHFDRWKSLSSLPMSDDDHAFFTVAFLKGNLFVVASDSSQIVKFSPDSESYATLNYTLPIRGYHHKVFAIGEHLFVIDVKGTYKIDQQGNFVKQFPAKAIGDWLYGTPTYSSGKVYFLNDEYQLASFDMVTYNYSIEIENVIIPAS